MPMRPARLAAACIGLAAVLASLMWLRSVTTQARLAKQQLPQELASLVNDVLECSRSEAMSLGLDTEISAAANLAADWPVYAATLVRDALARAEHLDDLPSRCELMQTAAVPLATADEVLAKDVLIASFGRLVPCREYQSQAIDQAFNVLLSRNPNRARAFIVEAVDRGILSQTAVPLHFRSLAGIHEERTFFEKLLKAFPRQRAAATDVLSVLGCLRASRWLDTSQVRSGLRILWAAAEDPNTNWDHPLDLRAVYHVGSTLLRTNGAKDTALWQLAALSAIIDPSLIRKPLLSPPIAAGLAHVTRSNLQNAVTWREFRAQRSEEEADATEVGADQIAEVAALAGSALIDRVRSAISPLLRAHLMLALLREASLPTADRQALAREAVFNQPSLPAKWRCQLLLQLIDTPVARSDPSLNQAIITRLSELAEQCCSASASSRSLDGAVCSRLYSVLARHRDSLLPSQLLEDPSFRARVLLGKLQQAARAWEARTK